MSDIDAQGIAIIFIGMVLAGFILTVILPPFFQAIRGPSTDFTINTVIDYEGNVSEYSVTIVLPDTYSYDKFAKYSYSQNYGTIKEYILRGFSDKQIFDYNYDPKKNTITLKSTDTFDPNSITNIIHIQKNGREWRFEDESFASEYFIPEEYINKLTYKLTLPSDVLNSNADSQGGIFSPTLTWNIDRHKETVLVSNNMPSVPIFYANASAPEIAEIPGFGIIVTIIGLICSFLIIKRINYT